MSLLSDDLSRIDASGWTYDPVTGRYRGASGRFLSKKAMDALVDGKINQLSKQLRDYTKRLANGSITIDQWQGSVREAIKMSHIQAAIIGGGGKDRLTSSDWGRIGQRLRAEYNYLQNFASEILAERISVPMALARIGLYAESVRGSYWEGNTIRREREGYSLMRRILDSQAKHCEDCLRYARAGIVPIGSLPLPGQRCECRARCKCSVEYLRAQFPGVPV